MDAAQWPKDVTSNGSYNKKQVEVEEKKVKPAHEEGMIKCPRCNSSNTKFCYYNNYSLTQPRYFCKACKRYWTKGGSLRSVPVGGGSRKNNKNRSISSSSSSSTPKPIDLSHLSSSQNFTTQQQQEYHHHHHLGFSQFLMPPKIENGNNAANLLSSSSSDHGLNSFSTRGATTTSWDLMLNGTRFGLQEDVKPTLGMGMGMGMEFPFQGIGIGNGIKYGNFQEGDIGEIRERNMLPFGVLNHQHHSSSIRAESGQISIMGQAANSTTGYGWNDQRSGGAGGSSTLYN